jgi:hypothetical protein
MSRRGRGKEDSAREPVVRAQGDSESVLPNGTQIPEGYQYTPDDPLHGKITTLIGEKVSFLYQKAVENPNSEANEIVRILLLNQIRHMQPEKYQEEPRLTLTEERRRGIEVTQKQEVYQHAAKRFEIFAAQKALEIERLKAQIKKLETDTQHKQVQIDKAQRILDQAQAAAEHQQPMDHMTIYNKIAEVIGIRPPAGQQLESSRQ